MSKIVLIEDNEQLQKLYEEKFKAEGFEFLTAADGKKGLDLVKSEKPALVLLDIMLPGGINGFDVLEQLKRLPDLKNIPVIVMTNLEGEEKVAKEIGAVDYLVKANITPSELIDRVKKIIK